MSEEQARALYDKIITLQCLNKPDDILPLIAAAIREATANGLEEAASVALSFRCEDREPPFRATPWAEKATEIAQAIRTQAQQVRKEQP